jgi:hypothetical protein
MMLGHYESMRELGQHEVCTQSICAIQWRPLGNLACLTDDDSLTMLLLSRDIASFSHAHSEQDPLSQSMMRAITKKKIILDPIRTTGKWGAQCPLECSRSQAHGVGIDLRFEYYR